MKVKLLFAGLMLAAGLTQAQYGLKTYYKDTLTNEWFNDGLITNQLVASGKPLYIGVGRLQGQTASSLERSCFVRTKFDGTAQYNRRIFVFRNGAELGSRLNAVAEGSSAFVMSGTVTGANLNPNPLTGGSDVLLMKTGATGIPTNTWRVDVGGADEALATYRSTKTNTNFFTAGKSTTPGAAGRAFLMRHSASGAIAWLKKFTIPCSGAIANTEITSIVQDSASGNVVVVGNYAGINTGCNGSFIARFTNAGALTWLYTYAPGALSNISFQSIRETGTPNVYVIAGFGTNPAVGGNRAMLIKVTTGGAAPVINWAMMYLTPNPTPNFPIAYQKGYDVVYRKNPSSGNEEFFLCGETGYTNGTTDGNVIKTGFSGAPVSCRFYFGALNQALYAIDAVSTTGTPGDGIASFGKWDQYNTTGSPIGSRSLLVKSYFNLVTGCFEIASTPSMSSVTLPQTLTTVTLASNYSADSLQTQYSSQLDATLCWNTTVSNGSNLRLGDEDEEMTTADINMDVLVYPNPVNAGMTSTMEVNTSTATDAMVLITDVTGRLIQQFTMQLQEGTNTFNLETSQWQAGMYLVQLKTMSGSGSVTRLIVQ